MPFTIKKESQAARLVRMGQASKVLAPGTETRAQGRKEMAEKKEPSQEPVPKKISEEDAGTQGAVGSGGVNAPAQEKVPKGSGNKEDK